MGSRPPYDFLFKVVLVGNAGVGKTSLLRRYVVGRFGDECFSSIGSIGIDFRITTFVLGDGTTVKLQIFDICGQERFRAIARAYYGGAHAVLLMYDITDERSFDDVGNWNEDVETYSTKLNAWGGAVPPPDAEPSFVSAVRMVVGTKCDLEQRRAVPRARGKECAENLGLPFMETSAKSNINLTEVFTAVAEEMTRLTREARAKNVPKEVIKDGFTGGWAELENAIRLLCVRQRLSLAMGALDARLLHGSALSFIPVEVLEICGEHHQGSAAADSMWAREAPAKNAQLVRLFDLCVRAGMLSRAQQPPASYRCSIQ